MAHTLTIVEPIWPMLQMYQKPLVYKSDTALIYVYNLYLSHTYPNLTNQIAEFQGYSRSNFLMHVAVKADESNSLTWYIYTYRVNEFDSLLCSTIIKQ